MVEGLPSAGGTLGQALYGSHYVVAEGTLRSAALDAIRAPITNLGLSMRQFLVCCHRGIDNGIRVALLTISNI